MSLYSRERAYGAKDSTAGVYTVQYDDGAKTVFLNDTIWLGAQMLLKDNISPNFKTRMSRGEIMLNDMQLSGDIIENDRDTITWNDEATGRVTLEGDHARRLERTLTTFLRHRLETVAPMSASVALVKAYSAMNSSDIMGGEILKDLGSTLGMLRKPFSTATDLLGRMVKNRQRHAGKTAASFARATASTWLEYRYGWRPLIGDSRTAIRLASKSRNNLLRRGRRIVRGFDEKRVDFAPLNCQSWLYTGALTVMLNGATTDSIMNRANAGIIFTLSEPSSEAERWSRSLGFTSKDILPTVWECVPFSFVMDWFVNIGDWLQAVTPNPFVQVLGSWTTVTQDALRITKGTWFWTCPNGHTHAGDLSENLYRKLLITRTVNPSLATYPVPKGKLLSALQTADGLGLMTQKIVAGLGSFKH